MFNKIDYVMVMVSDMAVSVAFYRDKLGLSLKFESPDWTEFQTGTTTLALHGGGKKRTEHRSGERDKQAGTCSIGFAVPDINQAYEELRTNGVFFVMPPTDRQEEGIKLAICLDPDGLPISLAQT